MLIAQHGMRLLIVDDFRLEKPLPNTPNNPKRSWISRLFRSSSVSHPSRPAAFQKVSTQQQQPLPSQPQMRERRSVSDIAHHIVHPHREPPKVLDLQSMVRLSGKSVLYLPPDFAPSTLVLPTCIRATAQHLAQHTSASGIFRIPGSVRLVNALFDYYCYMEKRGVDVSNTVHCANLPMHIQASVHDVASTFKRFVSVLPGGILGALSLFDAFVAIHSLLRGEPEFPRTKQTKVRARLIALAIGTIQSQFRRELICAVFGLLSLIGRAAEVAPREDENRRPLPTGDLMGYSALGIVFGPLLVGDLLEQYTMNLATPDAGLLLFPLSSPRKLQKGQRARRQSIVDENPSRPKEGKTVDKIHVANSITEMLIVNWRDVVRQMKSLGTHHRHVNSSMLAAGGSLRPSVSESFMSRQNRESARGKRESAVQVNRNGSPEPEVQPVAAVRQLPKSKKSIGSNKLRPKQSGTILSPTVEESSTEVTSPNQRTKSENPLYRPGRPPVINRTPTRPAIRRSAGEGTIYDDEGLKEVPSSGQRKRQGARQSLHEHEVSWEDVPPRTSSKQRGYFDSSMVSQSSQADHIERPDMKQFRDYTPQQEAVTVETPRRPITTSRSRPRDSLISEGSQTSYISASKAVEAKVSSPRRDINSEEFENMHALPKEPLDEDRALPSHRETRSSDQSRDPQPEKDGIGAPDTADTDNRQPSSQISEPVHNSSIETTPMQFYAAMKVPPGLAREMEEDLSTTRLSTTKESPTDMTDQVETRKASSMAEDELNMGDNGRTKTIKQHKGSLTADRLSRFEQFKRFSAAPQTRPFDASKSTGGNGTKTKELSSARTDDSEAKNKPAGVKAMAAMFEGHNEPPKGATARPKSVRRVSTTYPQSSPAKSIRPSKSGSMWDQASPTKMSWSTKTPKSVPRPSITNVTNQEHFETPKLCTSVSDSVALRAAAIMQAEKQHQGPSTERLPLGGLRQTPAQPKQTPLPDAIQQENQKKSMVNLGSWIAHQEQPPVATHLNLARPPSFAARSQQRGHDLVSEDSSTPIPRPRSTTSLHTQIRNLQRQLDTKTEEAAQLKRQLEAQENADVRTLSEQLREAKREAQMWKDRAEAAERRVQVFERFTARLKGIREAAVTADDKTSVQDGSEDSFKSDDGISPNQQVRFVEGKVSDRRTDSVDSGHTEDAGVVTARIRRCLHGSQGTHDGADEEGLPVGLDGTVNPIEVREIWMAAREFLDRESTEG